MGACVTISQPPSVLQPFLPILSTLSCISSLFLDLVLGSPKCGLKCLAHPQNMSLDNFRIKDCSLTNSATTRTKARKDSNYTFQSPLVLEEFVLGHCPLQPTSWVQLVLVQASFSLLL